MCILCIALISKEIFAKKITRKLKWFWPSSLSTSNSKQNIVKQCCGSDPFLKTWIRIWILLRSVFDIKQNKEFWYGLFLQILMTFKINTKQIILTKLYFRQFYMTRKLESQGSFFEKMDPEPRSVFFPNLDLGDPKRPEPTWSGSATQANRWFMSLLKACISVKIRVLIYLGGRLCSRVPL